MYIVNSIINIYDSCYLFCVKKRFPEESHYMKVITEQWFHPREEGSVVRHLQVRLFKEFFALNDPDLDLAGRIIQVSAKLFSPYWMDKFHSKPFTFEVDEAWTAQKRRYASTMQLQNNAVHNKKLIHFYENQNLKKIAVDMEADLERAQTQIECLHIVVFKYRAQIFSLLRSSPWIDRNLITVEDQIAPVLAILLHQKDNRVEEVVRYFSTKYNQCREVAPLIAALTPYGYAMEKVSRLGYV